jgi:hypothetical protein
MHISYIIDLFYHGVLGREYYLAFAEINGGQGLTVKTYFWRV